MIAAFELLSGAFNLMLAAVEVLDDAFKMMVLVPVASLMLFL